MRCVEMEMEMAIMKLEQCTCVHSSEAHRQ